MINKLVAGNVYAITENAGYIVQVGMGGDCGIFKMLKSISISLEKDYLFRVIIVEKDVKRLTRLGLFPLARSISNYQQYYERDVYPEAWYTVSLESPEERHLSNKLDTASLEPLAFWAIDHVIARINGAEFFAH